MKHWLVVCEDNLHFDVVTTLVDRSLHLHLMKVNLEDHIPSLREYVGAAQDERFLKWSQVAVRYKEHGLRPLPGKFNGGGSNQEGRKVLRLASKLPDIDAVILVRDQDRDRVARRAALAEARKAELWEGRAVVAVPIPEVEAWVLLGFTPRDTEETQRLEEERKKLGFDPTAQPQDLNPGRDFDQRGRPIKKAIKPVLERLTGDDPERRQACFREAPLDQLRKRGGDCGLSHFFDDLASNNLAARLGK